MKLTKQQISKAIETSREIRKNLNKLLEEKGYDFRKRIETDRDFCSLINIAEALLDDEEIEVEL